MSDKQQKPEKAFILPKSLWERPDILVKYDAICHDLLADRRIAAFSNLERPHWVKFFKSLEKLSLDDIYDFKIKNGVCTFESKDGRSSIQAELITACLESLMPWRKGPFSFFKQEVDAEWRSDKKWDRLLPFFDPLKGKKIADIGCSNGYSMLRLLENDPECVIGFDPGEAAFLQFEFCQKFLKSQILQLELFKDDALEAFPGFFEITLCMGVLYHHRNPLGLLKNLIQSTRTGGQVIVESQTYPGNGDFAFFNADRYAKAHNVYFVPTSDCLVSMMKKSGLKNVELVSEVEITGEEQRKTKFAPYQSLEDFVSEDDPLKTVEGHLTPTRSIVLGRVPR